MRKEYNIKKGDKFLVIGNPHAYHITLVNPDNVNKFFEMLTENINQIKSKINKKGYK